MPTATADPFAGLKPGPEGLAEGQRIYRRLSLKLHPDVAGDHADMAGLNAAWEAAQRRLSGTRAGDVTITSRRHAYKVLRPLVAGDVADLHVAECDGEEVLLKVARSPKDADLLAAEAEGLKAIHAAHDDGCNGWFPLVLESFAFSAPGQPKRRCNVLGPLRGFYSLEEVRDAGYVHPRDVAWIARRILYSLSQAHAAGRVHGGLVPAHVMVHPTEHRVVLVGWGGSVEVGQPLKVRVPGHHAWYPPEVVDRAPAGADLDLFMLGRMIDQSAWSPPGPATMAIRAFGRGCALANKSRRPKDALELLAEFDDLLERLWGARTYHEFDMPGPSRI